MHIGARDEYTLIRGRRFPNCPYCRTVSYELLQSHERYRRHRSRRGRPFGHYSDLHLSTPRVTALSRLIKQAGSALLATPSLLLSRLTRGTGATTKAAQVKGYR